MSARTIAPIAAAVLLLLPLLHLLAPAAAHGAYSPDDFDGDTVTNETDNCLLVANPDQEPGETGPDGAACSGEGQRSTIEALRFDYTAKQLKTIYGALDPGAMPGWDVVSRGWVRCQFNVECLGFDGQRQGNMLVNDPLIPILWRGQHFFTDEDGGYLMNRTLQDSRRDFRGEVAYGASPLDGGRAIVVTYPSRSNPFPINHIILECRTVQTGILDCFAWGHAGLGPLGEEMILLFNVFQDTTNPEL